MSWSTANLYSNVWGYVPGAFGVYAVNPYTFNPYLVQPVLYPNPWGIYW